MTSLKTKILTVTTAAALCAGALMAATTGHTGHRGQMGARMANYLGLTADQQTQAKALWQTTFQSTKPVRDQLRQERQALQAAVKAGKSDQEIQQLAQAEAPQLAQLAAARATTFAKFYAMLTPAQQQKLEQFHQGHHRGQHAPANQSNQ